MKKIGMLSLSLFLLSAAGAQQKQGRVLYERTAQMQVTFAGMNEEMARMIPKTRTDRFELTFGNNQSIWRQAEQEQEDEPMAGEGGMQIRVRSMGTDDVVYTNFDASKRVELRDIMDKKFLIEDSIRPLKWKMTGETKTILNHKCMKATTTQIAPRMMSSLVDGKIVRKETMDTSVVVAWFASDIPVSGGPGEFQGQLPGMILEMDYGNGRMVYKAIEIAEKADLAIIKEPSGKKRITPAEFTKERDKMLEEMQKNGGGGRTIRFQ